MQEGSGGAGSNMGPEFATDPTEILKHQLQNDYLNTMIMSQETPLSFFT